MPTGLSPPRAWNRRSTNQPTTSTPHSKDTTVTNKDARPSQRIPSHSMPPRCLHAQPHRHHNCPRAQRTLCSTTRQQLFGQQQQRSWPSRGQPRPHLMNFGKRMCLGGSRPRLRSANQGPCYLLQFPEGVGSPSNPERWRAACSTLAHDNPPRGPGGPEAPILLILCLRERFRVVLGITRQRVGFPLKIYD